MIVLHGWMDVSASFQFFVDALAAEWHVVAPDWRGYGETDWSGEDSYWFPDYYADLDVLLARISPERPVDLVAHSMGGNVACVYAGARPARVRRLVNLEGFGMSDVPPDAAPQRIAQWLDELATGESLRDYASFADLANRMRHRNPHLPADRAAFLAPHWGKQVGDRVRLRSDPAHKIVNPVPYRLAEAKACWARVAAPVLWVEGGETRARGQMRHAEAELASRRAAFPKLRCAIVEGAGHMLHHVQPARLARVVESFLSDGA